MENQYLRTYLNDHRSGAVVGLDLARRIRDRNEDTELGQALAWIADEIEEDRDVLDGFMDALDATRNPAKQAIAWVAEKAMRLKLNGRIIGHSPASRLVELEALMLGVSGKLALWRALEASGVRLVGPEAAVLDLPELIARAMRQRDELERWRLRAADEALAGGVREPASVGA
jgi:hypothetical protein